MIVHRTWVIGATAVAAVVLASGAAVAADPTPVPAEYTDPTPELVAASIHIWDPSGHVTAIETETIEPGQTINLDSDILFEFGSAELPAAAAARIEALVADIPDGAAVAVTGHTDDVGSDADNLVLSQQRAQAVAGAITAARPDLTLEVDGKGEQEPIASNAEASGREANRRVEIHFGA